MRNHMWWIYIGIVSNSDLCHPDKILCFLLQSGFSVSYGKLAKSLVLGFRGPQTPMLERLGTQADCLRREFSF